MVVKRSAQRGRGRGRRSVLSAHAAGRWGGAGGGRGPQGGDVGGAHGEEAEAPASPALQMFTSAPQKPERTSSGVCRGHLTAGAAGQAASDGGHLSMEGVLI